MRVSLDVRHADDPARKTAVEALLAQAEAIAARRGLALECTRQMDQPAVPMDERLTAFLAEAIEAAGLPAKRMPSGAGHDAMVMAARVPTAMLFLRSPGGISHHPDETVLEEDVEAALRRGARDFFSGWPPRSDRIGQRNSWDFAGSTFDFPERGRTCIT